MIIPLSEWNANLTALISTHHNRSVFNRFSDASTHGWGPLRIAAGRACRRRGYLNREWQQ